MSVLTMKGGAVEFLTKPVRNQDLLDVVQLAIGRDTTRRDAPPLWRQPMTLPLGDYVINEMVIPVVPFSLSVLLIGLALFLLLSVALSDHSR
jgi:hypothetical protein